METQTEMQPKSVAEVWVQRPLIISGPCSAETEDQLLATARQIAATGKVSVLRSGIWKPRTRPGNFEGVGVIGLPWLITARKETGLLNAVEVANARQVEEALSFGIDMLWVGARTTVNPFSVQEIADALKGTDIPVLVKNPVNPDLELWVGAVERIQKAGVSRIGLIHRGFSSYGNAEYRNAPMWHLAIEMRRRFPELLMLNDPSHIGGRRSLLYGLSQKAADLDFDGLIVESHCDPDNAWSDAKQQITPVELSEILDRLIWREESVKSEQARQELEIYRQQINNLDDELLQIIGERMKIAEKIGLYKRNNGVTILQTNRWNEIIERVSRKGDALGLSHEFVTSYFNALHMESINRQNKIMNEK